MEPAHDAKRLAELQALPLGRKIQITQTRIIEFYGGHHPGMGYGNAYISFSGGKDSTVLLDIARKIYPEIPAVFSNTGLEYPEIRRFAKAHDNVEVVQPKIPFNEVISRYGYPLIGKEVAEAIYYARKIRSHDVQVEREPDGGHLIQTSSSRSCRTVLMGAYPLSTHTHTQRGQPNTTGANCTGTGCVCQTQDGTHGNPHNGRAEKSKAQSRGETSWANWRRGCL